jgi:predicted nucleotidyltransferase
MRIDPKESIAGQPALLVRQTLRRLRDRLQWRVEDLESTASLKAGKARLFLETLLAEGLVESTGPGTWTITQAGQSLSSATAAKRVTRATAEKSLQEFSRRVERVNREPYFLGKVTRVVLFGSMLKPEVERVSDVDLAVEIVEKEADSDLSRSKNYDRAEELAAAGHRFRNVVEMAGCWHLEVFRLRGGRELRLGRTASISTRKARTECSAKSAEHAKAPGPGAAFGRLPILRNCRTQRRFPVLIRRKLPKPC